MKRKTKGIIKLIAGSAVIAGCLTGIGVSAYKYVESDNTINELQTQYSQTEGYAHALEQRDARLAFINKQLDNGSMGQREHDDEKAYYNSEKFYKDVYFSLDESGILKQAYSDRGASVYGIVFPAAVLVVGAVFSEVLSAVINYEAFFQSAINDIRAPKYASYPWCDYDDEDE